MPADQRPSYEDLAAENAGLRAMVETLQAQVAELVARLGQNSRNSSQPPSSDSPFVTPAPKSLRRRSGRKPGGQPGHPGSTLALVTDPNERVRHEPGPCGGCGANVADAPEAGVERRQVFDLPPITVEVTEHQLITRRCVCGTTTSGTAPHGVTAPVQYGPRITAIVVYLHVGQFLSRKRTAQALAELFGTPVSQGTVAAMTKRAADGPEGFPGRLKDHLAQAEEEVDVDTFRAELLTELPGLMVECLLPSRGSVPPLPTDLATDAVPDVLSKPALTFAEWARDQAADFR